MTKTIIISLGGSIIVPDEIDTLFLKSFKKTIENYIKKGYSFVIYAGGGKIARHYQNAASEISMVDNEDLDWLGIYCTKLNALLIKTIFKNDAEKVIFENPNNKTEFKKNILIASGWKPGWSTDYDAVLAAKQLGIKEIINMSNIDYVYDKDPKKFNDAKKIEKISWNDYRKLISYKWNAGMNAPFDPVASKEAQKLKMKVVIVGKELKNFENYMLGKTFIGTVIK